MDALTEAGRAELRRQARSLHEVIEGLPPQALDWRPGPDTNSLAILVTHAWGAAEAWTARAAGQEIPRDRDAEFTIETTKAGLDRLIDQGLERIEGILDAVEPDGYAEARPASAAGDRLTRASCLIRAIQHTQEHVGQALLTRQLWEQQSGRSA
ncbi:MAG TPA: DinB family protein [Candidatus Limnocylindrales bacterium]|nr:DinB family protein [Candidatus Limnocylindrales bacterium]